MNVLFIENAGNTNAGAFHSLIALIKLLEQYGVKSFVALPDRADGKHLLIEKSIQFIEMRECSYTLMISNKASCFETLKMYAKDVLVKSAANKLYEFIKEHDIQIVHENTSACYIGYFAAKKARVKHVWHIREFMEEDFDCHLWRRNRTIHMMNSSDAIISISNAVEEKYRKVLNGHNIYKVYNGILVQSFLDADRTILTESEIRLLCVGRICDGKGQKTLLHALGELRKDNIIATAYFAGSYSEEIYNDYYELAKQLNVETQINFLGQVKDMKTLYKTVDVFCMCSKCEAFGRVTVEAMLAGDLIIGTNSGGTLEILDAGKYGLLFPANDYNALANQIKYAVEHASEMRELAAQGRKHAMEVFDARLNAQRIYDIYNKILK